jgi:hypothetical protein
LNKHQSAATTWSLLLDGEAKKKLGTNVQSIIIRMLFLHFI